MRPQRIQRQRTKGWRMPEGATYVGRPTRYGNPFIVERVTSSALAAQEDRWFGDQEARWYVDNGLDAVLFVAKHDAARYAADLFESELGRSLPLTFADIEALRGRDLVCWCPPDMPCHADLLLKIANDTQVMRSVL